VLSGDTSFEVTYTTTYAQSFTALGLTALPEPTKKDYNFGGWFIDSNDNKVLDANETDTISMSEFVRPYDIHLYPRWTFNTIAITSVLVEGVTKPVAADLPVIAGIKPNDCSGAEKYKVTSALWGTFLPFEAGGSYTITVTLEACDGYTFNGIDAYPNDLIIKDNDGADYKATAGAVTDVGGYVGRQFTISYTFNLPATPMYLVNFVDSLDNNKVISRQSVERGQGATAPVAPTHYGYKFIGWDSGYANVTRNMTIRAQYATKNPPEITFAFANNMNVNVQAVAQGDTVTVTATGLDSGDKVSAYVYSVTVELGEQIADANGVARWTWTVPADFEIGEHIVEVRHALISATASLYVFAPAPEVVAGGSVRSVS
jgi:hypothetical protein